MAAETLREFLVELGFHTDETSLKKFLSSVEKVTMPVFKLGGAALATAGAVEVMVERVAHQMNDLFYASQRAGSTVSGMMDIGFAARQIGMSAAAGQSALENFGMTLRTNPGAEGLLNQFGIQTRDAHGHLLNMQETFDKFLIAMHDSGQPFFVQQQFAALLGMTPAQFYQYERNLPTYLAQQRELATIQREMGYDADAAAPKFATFNREVGGLEARIETLADVIAVKFLPASEKLVKWADNATTHFKPLLDDLDAILGTVQKLWAVFEKINTATGGLAGKAVEAGTGGLPAIVAEQHDVVTDPSKMPIHANKAWLWEHLKAGGKWIWNHRYLPLGISNNNPLNLQPGGHEADFSSPEAGYIAGMRQLMAYGHRGWNSINSIIAHWDAGDTTGRISAYINDVSHRSGYSAGTPLNLSDPAVLARLANAMTFHEQGMNPYGPELTARAAMAAVNISAPQTTNITVNGSSDPAGTAKKIGAAQGKVNADIVRNLASVVK